MNDSFIPEDVIENRNDDVNSKTYFSCVDDLLSSTFVCPFYISVFNKMLRKCSYVLADDVAVNFVDIRLQLLLDPFSLAHYLVSRDDWRVCMAQLWFLL